MKAIQVKALRVGYYDNKLIQAGQIFTIAAPSKEKQKDGSEKEINPFSESWMEKVSVSAEDAAVANAGFKPAIVQAPLDPRNAAKIVEEVLGDEAYGATVGTVDATYNGTKAEKVDLEAEDDDAEGAAPKAKKKAKKANDEEVG